MAVPPPAFPWPFGAMTEKPALRARLRAVRDGHVLDLAHGASIAVPAAYAARLRPGVTVAGYVPIGSEADPAALLQAAREAGCRIALPHVTTRAAPIRFLSHDADTPLAAGPFGLRQPPDDAAAVRPNVILAPLLGFDRAGNRLGQGAGHYDRAFAACPDAWRVGVAWSIQQVDSLAADPWDMPLHAIATESHWIVP